MLMDKENGPIDKSFWDSLLQQRQSRKALPARKPDGKKLLFGAWVHTGNIGQDSPRAFNERLGHKTSVAHFAQSIPNYAADVSSQIRAIREHLLEETDSDAALMLTVYPSSGFDAIDTSDYEALAGQVAYYTHELNRQVFLRFAPEMQGYWNTYGMQPTKFIETFRTVHKYVKQVANNTALVWAPNLGQNYPWGSNFDNVSKADRKLLDTNGNGKLDAGDDPYKPYYPGDEYVDWSGISLYYKGPWASETNQLPWDGYCEDMLSGRDTYHGATTANFYGTYCQSPDRPCMLSESGSAYHVHYGGTPHWTFQRKWIEGCITNTTFFDTHPRLKMIIQFEFEKSESAKNGDDLRDFRITGLSSLVKVTRDAFDAASDYFQWANDGSPKKISHFGRDVVAFPNAF